MITQAQGFQLSPQQQRLWLLQQDNSVYHACCAIVITGNLQVNVLKDALHKVVDRNEILRTKFYRPLGIKIPSQVIEASDFLFLEADIVSNHSFSELIDKELSQITAEDLLVAKLLRVNKDSNILLISIPALCADTVSLSNLVAEISSCYSACLQNDDILDEPLQYADIAAWLNELLAAEESDAGRRYWQQIDISRCGSYKLINENPQQPLEKFQPQVVNTTINQQLVNKIDQLTQKYQTTTATFLLTCWLILLWRLTGTSDLIIGTAFDGRNYEELKASLGLFAKYLPLTCPLENGDRFTDILAKVNHITTEMSDWQENFSWETANQQDGSTAFFPFCFEFTAAPQPHKAGEVTFTLYQHYVCSDRFKVKLAGVHTVDDELKAEFHYDGNLFAIADVENLANQFVCLLESAVEHPQANISQLNILTPAERKQLLIDFNNTKTPELPYQCIHHWFEAQCQQTPDNIAVVFAEQKLTYQELNKRANQLAHYLQSLGVGSEQLIGICVERSLLMVIGVLGILKAGAAYVPIDPNYPIERKEYILADTQMSLLLTQASLAANFPADNITTICLDTDSETINQQPQTNPISPTNADNLAYVIYTSGSTGKPKGTLIEHSGLVNYLNWCTQAYEVEQGSGTLVHSSLGFDLTITSLFSPLLVGSQVELLPEHQAIETLAQTIKARSNLSLVKITPAHLELLSQQLTAQEAAGRTNAFIIGGENLTTQHINFWQKYAPDTVLINEYGPTETVVGCCIYQVPRTHNYVGSIPIGHPIANTQLYVLDQYLQPVPKGVIGELYIGGAGLARGYLNQPELTAKKFIPHPFNPEPGARLYRTGDQVRLGVDGTLEFLGRLDDQVKLRGFRIELGEIESLLSLHPTVKDAVVTVREDVAGDQRLVAYLVVQPESSLSVEDLRRFLQQKLPDYMIPSAFLALQNFPLTANGKVDRKALPAPDKINAQIEQFFVAPRNSLEAQIAEIWSQVLRVEKVGIHHNFFTLGGHSLLMTQLISRMRDALGVELLIQEVFANPTVAELSVIVTQKLAEQVDDESLARSLAELNDLNQTSIINLAQETILDSTIYPSTFWQKHETASTSILLTGATGFLGAFLLFELLQQSQTHIYCLVRASNLEIGKRKLQKTLESYLIWDESFSQRITPIIGDLSQPLLGMNEAEFQKLASTIDIIYHNGAWVNHIYPYSILKPANVLGTQEILRLASKIKTKPVHFISSSGVVGSKVESGVMLVREQDSLKENEFPSNGYSQTKWVAERLVQTAAERGIPISIYRPSRISGHSQTGVFNRNDFLYKLIIGCVQLGSAPDRDIRENIIPVDYVSKAIVHLSKQEKSLGKAFHLTNPQLLHSNMLIDQFRLLGYAIEQISYEQWRAKLLDITKGSVEHPLYPLVPFFPSSNFEDKTSNSGVLQFDCQNTLNGLAGTSIVCPPVNEQLLHIYFSYLIRKGYLAAPTQMFM
jgi:amino acid adenylation domain-containing protein/thioester reductase-like protein